MTNAQLGSQDTEVQDVAEEISDILQAAFDLLIERRETAFADAIKPLDAERDTLEQESASIGEARRNLERLLPAKAREAQRAADALTLAGDAEGAEAKLTEAQEAANAPAAMIERQREISARLEALEEDKKNAARKVFEGWYAEAQHIIRASEHGFFIGLLDEVRNAMYDYQEAHGLQATVDRPFSFLVKDHHLQGLTAPERSPEWRSSQNWYGGRVR